MDLKVNQNQKRIDKFLTEETDYSRNMIQKMIESGFILINGKVPKANYIVKEGEIITINEDYKEETKVEAEDIPLDIVFEDADLMVINKPSGMVVHPGSGNNSGTLVNALMGLDMDLSDDEVRPGIVHRIDKDTTGLILVAKNNKTHELLSEMFKNKTINREYIALLSGEFKTNTATIDAPIGRDARDRKRMNVTDKNAKEAVTHLIVIKRYKGYTLVRLSLETGRTHQIRVHMKYIGFPVHNDPVYTKKESDEFGQFLHSEKLTFIHPITKEKMSFIQELPKEFSEYINNLTEIE